MSFVNNINTFNCRFDSRLLRECKSAGVSFSSRLEREEISQLVTEDKVVRKVNPSKALGPDHVEVRILKECSGELTGALCQLFNNSLHEHSVPSSWKRSEIRPIPKKSNPEELNDCCRPVALTSVVVKCMERLVLPRLMTQVRPSLDALQFVYGQNQSVEDGS
ncbi:hypothetical protein SKAU_G00311910 [Synaphobranchus kaupii]|uniref:Reverse transcriptase n=1 Tax=Synaphobranchus kaupii TaxID=118154 RepID=A0A9Q1ERY2_SYNKA|nr:hypothetical protein SKAU_G00311910 [Synaphobranchus kaupii]